MGVPVPTFKLWGRSQVLGSMVPRSQVLGYWSHFYFIPFLSHFVTQIFPSYIFMKIFWKKNICILYVKYFLSFWVVGNGGYSEGNLKLKQNSKFFEFFCLFVCLCFFFLIFVLGSSLPQVAPFPTTQSSKNKQRLC